MGLNLLFSSDSRDCDCSRGYPQPEEVKVVRVNSTPDPTKFEIVKKIVENHYPILWVRYPDVKNYEGHKILMYDKHFDLELLKDRIDPHFFTEGDSPIARFVPTAAGWAMAIILANNLP